MRKKWLVIISLILIGSSIRIFHKFFFSIDQVNIQGITYLDTQLIQKLIDQKESLFSLDKDALIQQIKKIDFVEEVHISLRLMHTLMVEIEEKKLVADIFFNGGKYFLTSKGEIIRGKSFVSINEIPRINLKKKEHTDYLISVGRNLEWLAYHDRNFFKKIKEISFDDSPEANIFILCDSNKYILNPNFSLDDLMKIRFIHNKALSFKVFDLRGNYIVVNS